MRRLLYSLLGSTLFHGALLWVPFPMSAGGAGEDTLQPVRVDLVYVSRTEAPKRVSRQPAKTEKPEADSRAKAAKTRPKPKRPEAPTRFEIRVAKTVPTAPKRVNPTPARTRPAAKMRPKRPRPEPTRPPELTAKAKSAEDTRPEHAAATARKPADETRGNARAVTEEHLTRGVAKKTPANHGPQPGAGFSPARYAQTVPPAIPERRAGPDGRAPRC